MIEYDPDTLFEKSEQKYGPELTVGQLLEKKKIKDQMRKEKIMARRIDYQTIATELISNHPEFDSAILKDKLEVSKVDQYYFNKLKDTFKSKGYGVNKIRHGHYKLVELNPFVEEKSEQKKSKSKTLAGINSNNDLDKKIFEAVDKRVTLMVNNELDNAVVNALDKRDHIVVSKVESMLQETGQEKNISDSFLLLNKQIKDPSTMIEFNDFFESQGIPLRFEIKDVELVSYTPNELTKKCLDAAKSGYEDFSKTTNRIIVSEEKIEAKKVEQHYLSVDKPKIIAVTCPHCLETIYKNVLKDEEINCFKCGEAFYPEKEYNLNYAKYRCNSCNKTMNIGIGDTLDLVKCIDCSAPVDILKPDKDGIRYSIGYKDGARHGKY